MRTESRKRMAVEAAVGRNQRKESVVHLKAVEGLVEKGGDFPAHF